MTEVWLWNLKYDLHTKPGWKADTEIHEDTYFGLCGGSFGSGSGVFRRMFLVTKVLAPSIKQAKTH